MHDNIFSIFSIFSDWFEKKKNSSFKSIKCLVHENIHDWPRFILSVVSLSTGCYLKTQLNLYQAKCLHRKKSFYLCKCTVIKISLTTPSSPVFPLDVSRFFSSVFTTKFPCTFPHMVLVRSLLHSLVYFLHSFRNILHSVFRLHLPRLWQPT